ncbi:diacylglycerol/lipid kinase family protein [Arcanobacterium pinnipediorum]|uniref:DAGKc domain-containing protein n=1 Tax=Arcanobacterium pinnipediorum TaxID=1503041 RepID=A0ABY5AF02_9ACTO|nr:diacylglycerol kinase family protein [Arcanobacterium pinnipediorum]USR78789.1 hypothetical protein NG665_05180 [Arcanobacterium pinnipediorum]
MDHSPFSSPPVHFSEHRPYIRFILSRGAGKGRAHALTQEILRHYPHATHTRLGDSRPESGQVTISLTRGPDHVRELALEWDRFWGDQGVCYVAGGDGSVNEVASALVGKGCAFGVIPAGTGNDFARSLYQGDVRHRQALELVAQTKHSQFSPIDVLKVNDQYSVNVFSLGYDTEVLHAAMRIQRRMRMLGSSAYVAGVMRTLLRRKSVPLHFEYLDISGQRVIVDQSCIAFVVGNGRMYGGGYQPLPQALLDDSVADLFYADQMGLMRFARLLSDYRFGRHITKPEAHMAQVHEIDVERSDGEPLLWNVDGIVCESQKVHIKTMPHALTLARLPLGEN